MDIENQRKINGYPDDIMNTGIYELGLYQGGTFPNQAIWKRMDSIHLDKNDLMFDQLGVFPNQIDVGYLFSQPLLYENGDPWFQSVNYSSEKAIIEKCLQDRKDGFISKVGTFQNLKTMIFQQPKVLHFTGHGQREPSGYKLILEEWKDSFLNACGVKYMEKIDPPSIGSLLNNHSDDREQKIDLIVFSSCHSQQMTEQLFKHNICTHAIYIKRQYQVQDKICLEFAENLYSFLFKQGLTICQSFKRAKDGLKSFNQVKSQMPYNEYLKFKIKIQEQQGIKHQCFSFNDQLKMIRLNSNRQLLIKENHINALLQSVVPLRTGCFVGRNQDLHELIVRLEKYSFLNIIGKHKGMGSSKLIKEACNFIYEREFQMAQNGVYFIQMGSKDESDTVFTQIINTLQIQDLKLKPQDFIGSLKDKRVIFFFNDYSSCQEDKQFFDELLAQCMGIKLVFASSQQISPPQSCQQFSTFYIQPLSPKDSFLLLRHYTTREFSENQVIDLFEQNTTLLKDPVIYQHDLFQILNNPINIIQSAKLLSDNSEKCTLSIIFDLIRGEIQFSNSSALKTGKDPQKNELMLFNIFAKRFNQLENYGNSNQMKLLALLSLLPSGATQQHIYEIYFIDNAAENPALREKNFIMMRRWLQSIHGQMLIEKTSKEIIRKQTSSSEKVSQEQAKVSFFQMNLCLSQIVKTKISPQKLDKMRKQLFMLTSVNRETELNFVYYEQNIRSIIKNIYTNIRDSTIQDEILCSDVTVPVFYREADLIYQLHNCINDFANIEIPYQKQLNYVDFEQVCLLYCWQSISIERKELIINNLIRSFTILKYYQEIQGLNYLFIMSILTILQFANEVQLIRIVRIAKDIFQRINFQLFKNQRIKGKIQKIISNDFNYSQFPDVVLFLPNDYQFQIVYQYLEEETYICLGNYLKQKQITTKYEFCSLCQTKLQQN